MIDSKRPAGASNTHSNYCAALKESGYTSTHACSFGVSHCRRHDTWHGPPTPYLGIVALLDEESIRPGDKSDAIWLEKISKSLGSHKHLRVRKGMADKSLSATEFCIVHYAGDVVYDCTGFLEKNADTLYKDLARVMFKSSNPILTECFPGRVHHACSTRPVHACGGCTV